MVSVLAVVLMWVLACMGLECWLDGLWGVQGAGMLAGGECIARSSSMKEATLGLGLGLECGVCRHPE